jgi:hypothetical protein
MIGIVHPTLPAKLQQVITDSILYIFIMHVCLPCDVTLQRSEVYMLVLINGSVTAHASNARRRT